MRSIDTPQTRRTPAARWAVLGAVLLAALIGPGRPAGAQIEMRTFYRGFSPTVSREDISALRDTLELDSSQEELVASLYIGYRNEYGLSADAARDNLERIRVSISGTENPGLRENLLAEYSRIQDEWGRLSSGLEVSFFADIKDLLTEGQTARWPRYERDRRRRAGLLLAARLMPERVDLVALLDSLKLPDEVWASCEATVDQYTLDFDARLAQRIRLADQMETLSSQRGDKADDGQMQSLQQRLIRLHVEIRDINLDYLERIAGQLPMADGKRFREAFQKRVWPRVFGADPVGDDVQRVRRLTVLAPQQEEAVASLVAAYESRVEPINRELVQVEMTQEMQRLSPPVQQGTGKLQPGATGVDPEALEDRSRTLLESRRALVQTTLADIRTVLTAEQLRSLTGNSSFGEEDENHL